MCGIAGVVAPSLSSGNPAMLAVQSHRGPDDVGDWLSPSRVAWLGHRRLTIIDPRGGGQPMVSRDGRYVLVFNGCIFNYVELRRELCTAGVRFDTLSDTEVLLQTLITWGPAGVERLNGMWAFAFWDEREQMLLCSRDRLGIKPLYYAVMDDAFVFASEIKGILASGRVHARSDSQAIGEYLTLQFCLGSRTLFHGIRRLEPGMNAFFSVAHGLRSTRYWALDAVEAIDISRADAIEKVAVLASDAVRLRLRADVPIGAHLSGGLDSSYVVSEMRRLLGPDADIYSFTGRVDPGSACDEGGYARIVAERKRTHAVEIDIRAQQLAEDLPRIIWHMDEPAAGPGVYAQFCVCRVASSHVRVLLGGQGGDEVFLGYVRYLLVYLFECLAGAINDTAQRATFAATLKTIADNLAVLQGYGPMVDKLFHHGVMGQPVRNYYHLLNRFPAVAACLSPDFTYSPDEQFDRFREYFEAARVPSLVNRMVVFETATSLQALLQVEDRTSMAWGLESRVPLLDHRLVEALMAIPPAVKFQGGELKHLLKPVAARTVPEEIVARKDKMGFPIPLGQWAQGPLRDFVTDTLTSRAARERGLFDTRHLQTVVSSGPEFDRALWGALCLELWFQQFVDSPVVGHV